MIGAAVFQLSDPTGSVNGNSWMRYVILHGNQYAKIMGSQGINRTFGGLVRWSDPGSIFLTSNNRAYLENAGVKIMNSTVQGGFLYLEKGDAVIYDMQFDYSLETRFGAFSTLVADWHGGVVYAADNATLRVQECLFRGIDVSEAGKNGGALHVLHSELIVIDSDGARSPFFEHLPYAASVSGDVRPRVRYVRVGGGSHVSIGAKRNRGVALARAGGADAVVFFDDDCVYAPT